MVALKKAIEEIFYDNALIYGVLSDPKLSDQGQKVTIRKIRIKEKTIFQIEKYQGKQVFHTNLSSQEAHKEVEMYLKENYRQGMFFCSSGDYQIRISKKGKLSIIKKEPSRKDAAQEHNRTKKYLLPEGQPIPWLVELGIMTPQGNVVKNKYDKFRQINRYLEFVQDTLETLKETNPIRIVDFGCGKAYLTFALYDWLANHNGLNVEITGLDLKEDVIEYCTQLANRLEFKQLKFEKGDIAHYNGKTQVDMVICLHACDTATDYALAKAVEWGAKVIMAVPCCHKELIPQIQVDGLESMLQHGLVRERFGSMATDTLRALALEVMGYQTILCEFIDMEHTPKNILIRGLKNRIPGGGATKKYNAFKKTIGVSPGLENAFCSEFRELISKDESIENEGF